MNINSIGKQLINCKESCKGILKDRKIGVYPRCLFYENKRKPGREIDYVVIGINPGQSAPLERAFVQYIEKNNRSFKFEDMQEVMKPMVQGYPYYEKVRKFLERVRVDKEEHLVVTKGKKNLNILWTELVKCESKAHKGIKKKLSFKIKELCFQKYLLKELNSIKQRGIKPILVFLGYAVEAFFIKYLKTRVKSKKKITLNDALRFFRLYHPTGSWRFNKEYFRRRKIENSLKKTGVGKIEIQRLGVH